MAVVATLSKGYDLDYIWKQVDRGPAKDGASYYIQASETAGEPPGRWWGPGASGHDGDMSSHQEPAEMFQRLPFPFPGEEFAAELGAVIQRTVLDGHEPAREVCHSADNSWMVGDGLNNPNEPGACAASHMQHVVARNSSVADLASLPLGYRAIRPDPGHPWVMEPSGWADEQ